MTSGDMHALGMPTGGIPGGYQRNLSLLCDAAPLWRQHELKRAYFSSITYIDFLVGET